MYARELGSMFQRVSVYYTYSEHQAILLDIGNGGGVTEVKKIKRKIKIAGWPTVTFEKETFIAALKGSHDPQGIGNRNRESVMSTYN